VVVTSGGRRQRDRRAQLAQIAAELFRQHGYHNVGVGDIAAAAGITGPAVYRHFANKQAILGHVVLSGLDSFAASIAPSIAATAVDGSVSGDWCSNTNRHSRPSLAAERLRIVAASVSQLAVERRELGALWRREGRNLATADRAALVTQARQAVQFGVDLVRGVRPSLSEADAALLCWASLSVWGSIADHHVALSKARFEALLTEMVLAIVRCDAVPAPDGGPSSTTIPGVGGTWSTPIAQPRREQLLTLAARMFRVHGYRGVTMEDIGAAAGITGPSIYRHYTGKADLLRAMCDRVGGRLRAGVESALQAGHEPRPALRQLTTSFVHTVLQHRDLVAAYLMEGRNLPERDRTELRRLQRDYLTHWVALLAALDPTLDDKQARIRVHAAFAVVNDLARTGRFAPRPHLADELVTLALAVLVPTRLEYGRRGGG
jgi:AcrR family transcriptional regulator